MQAHNALAALSRENWDAVVIGAGPAGTIAARQLALQGRSVLLLDKSTLPRNKVCGGCLGGAALEALASAGLGDLPVACGGVTLSTFALACGGGVARLPVGRRVAISRRTFDNALVHEAKRAGVIVCDNVSGKILPSHGGRVRTVLLRHASGEFTTQASVVIVATGLAPCQEEFATQVSKNSYIGLGTVVNEAPIDMAEGTLHMACSIDGYVGITSVDNGAFDIAAAVNPHALAGSMTPGQLVHDILAQSGPSPRIDLRRSPWQGTPLLTRRVSPLASHRCLLIGDAAGYVEPFTGEGIGWAIHSALMATALLEGPLDAWDPHLPSHWHQVYYNSLAAKQRTCRVFSRSLRSRTVRRIASECLRHVPSLGRPMVTWLDRPLAAPIPT